MHDLFIQRAFRAGHRFLELLTQLLLIKRLAIQRQLIKRLQIIRPDFQHVLILGTGFIKPAKLSQCRSPVQQGIRVIRS